jgi:SPP1 gp7 family putative phage head morphogenesis protein
VRGRMAAVPDIQGLKVAIDTPWAGANYSARIWGAQGALAKELQETISSGFLSGRSYARTAQEIQQTFGVHFRDAERLVRTETSYIAGQAHLQAYRHAGIETYRYKASLDNRTCKFCAPLDGQILPVGDAEVGVNYPPIHPNCRCTTGAADDYTGEGQRIGKDANGKNTLLPADMTYSEWQDWQLAGAPADVLGWRLSVENTPGLGYTVTADGISTSTTKHMMMRLQE